MKMWVPVEIVLGIKAAQGGKETRVAGQGLGRGPSLKRHKRARPGKG